MEDVLGFCPENVLQVCLGKFLMALTILQEVLCVLREVLYMFEEGLGVLPKVLGFLEVVLGFLEDTLWVVKFAGCLRRSVYI